MAWWEVAQSWLDCRQCDAGGASEQPRLAALADVKDAGKSTKKGDPSKRGVTASQYLQYRSSYMVSTLLPRCVNR